MTRKLASLLLALAMVLMMVPAVSATAEADIPVIDWYFGIGEAANSRLQSPICHPTEREPSPR